jgi:putative DNA primase/helicase
MHNFNDRIDFGKVKQAARGYEGILLRRILPHTLKQGHEYVSLNPTRPDRNLGSFRINAHTCLWADFATGDKGGDIISLWAYVRQVSQVKAAQEIMTIVGGA